MRTRSDKEGPKDLSQEQAHRFLVTYRNFVLQAEGLNRYDPQYSAIANASIPFLLTHLGVIEIGVAHPETLTPREWKRNEVLAGRLIEQIARWGGAEIMQQTVEGRTGKKKKK